MKVSRAWLQTFFEKPLPEVSELERILTFGAFEIEGTEAVGEDTVLDVKVLPNRAHDCLCHRGIAKEFSVLCNIPLSRDPLSGPVPSFEKNGVLHVSVEKENACPVYQAALMKGITVGPSPKWLKERLETLGQRSINNVVDATNFVMLELGQPLHAFDAKKLGDVNGAKSIAVRMARAGESITVLGGTTYELDETIQLITDASGDTPLAIAGIKGGSQAEVDTATADIVLESAKFHPTLTRKASQKLKLRTDASYRFENEIPDELPLYALQALVALIKDVAGGEVVGYGGWQRVRATLPYKIGVSSNEVNKLLGTALSDDELSQIFDRFSFSYAKIENPREVMVQKARSVLGVPYKRMARIRFDTPESFNCSSLTAWCAVEAGYSLGVARIAIDQFAYLDEISEGELQLGDFVFTNTEEIKTIDGEVYSSALGEMVHDEAIRTKTLEFLPGLDIGHGVDHVGIYAGDGKIIHASSTSGGVVEEDLATSAIFAKEKWYRRLVTDTSPRFSITVPFERMDMHFPADVYEEVGRAYGYEHIPTQQLPVLPISPEVNPVFTAMETVRKVLAELGFFEIYSYTLCEKGDIQLANAMASDKSYIRNTLAPGVVEALTKNEYYAPFLGLSDVKIFEIGNVFNALGEHVHVCLGARPLVQAKKSQKANAMLLEAKEKLESALGVDVNEFITEETLEFDLSVIAQTRTFTQPEFSPVAHDAQFTPMSTYPFMLRDIAVWVPVDVTAEEISKTIRTAATTRLVKQYLFDSFQKDEKISYAFHLVFQSHERTLEDMDVNIEMENITYALHKKGDWTVR
jgi:phenylalanyl-tRNA synthetase beta subunit